MSFSKRFDIKAILHQVDDCMSVSDRAIYTLVKQTQFTIHDIPALISPAAEGFLEPLAKRSQNLTRQRFGQTMQLYAPLYLSNVCENHCLYCGFSKNHRIKRKTLSMDEIKQNAQKLKDKGCQHILLLTGESPTSVKVDYLCAAISSLSGQFPSIGLEVYPMSTSDYKQCIESGADSLTIYQETYHPQTYQQMHPKGLKSNFNDRLEAADRAGQAGFYRINIGALLGLSNWRFEAMSLAQHLQYLVKTYWQTKFSISVPRIQEMGTSFQVPHPVADKHLAQMIIAFRLVFPDVGITLSTRESAVLRDNLVPLGVTTISAESNTSPGGYASKDSDQQFDIADKRTIPEIKQMLAQKGYELVYKDWDRCIQVKNL